MRLHQQVLARAVLVAVYRVDQELRERENGHSEECRSSDGTREDG